MDLLAQTISLNKLRETLIRLEDTIIFALIERAQFKHNAVIYQPGGIKFQDASVDQLSFLRYFLGQVELVHARVRRYQSPDEYPFTLTIEQNAVLKQDRLLDDLVYPALLHANSININDEIYDTFTKEIIPRLCQPGDDTHYGSSATRDIECLQALSRRIHYGKFIAEAKFRQDEQGYRTLILNRDYQGLWDKLTVQSVEEKLLKRVYKKAVIYGADLNDENDAHVVGGEGRVDPMLVTKLYENWVIPFTKKVEVEYLLQRLS